MHAYSPVPLTLTAHCSLFTGTCPPHHRVRNNGVYYLDEGNVTLAEVLKKEGFRTAASGRIDESLKEYALLIEDFPEEASVYIELSDVYKAQGNRGKAVESMKKAVEFEPSPEIFYKYAFLLEENGDLEGAVLWLGEYLDALPDKNTPAWREAEALLKSWKKRLE